MPSNWLSIDTGFPSFTGKETPSEQIRALHNYLFQMREGLQYTLQNLTADNFNTAALENMTDGQKTELTEQLAKVYATLNGLSAEMDSLTGRVAGMEDLSGRVTTVEDTQKDLAEAMAELEGRTEDNAALLAQQKEADADLAQRVTTAEEALEVQAENAADLTQRVADVEEALEELTGRVEELERLTGVLKAEDGATTLGVEDTVLNLVGQIYINGVPYEQGEST